jgi:molybdopterin/thiamine biosynthesis adenylyltransferase
MINRHINSWLYFRATFNPMENRYSRNRIYMTKKEQKQIKDFPILLGGCGIGSVIAECALRFGFENITVVDGDQVEMSNLNRQNYTEQNISESKAMAVEKRLKHINQKAKIVAVDDFLDKENLKHHLQGKRVAINALDFSSDVPLHFDRVCQEQNIPVLHPYNLGWAGLLLVIHPEGLCLQSIQKNVGDFNEVDVVRFASEQMKFCGKPEPWIDEVIEKYQAEKKALPPPQLAVGSWILASMTTHVLFNIATGKRYKIFPEFYLSSLMND